jgi:uncharacterized protein
MPRPTARNLPKPDYIFDRELEWSELTAWATDDRRGPKLAVVSGRRRQGKSFLLEALAEATDGFYFTATETSESVSLRLLGNAVADYTGAPGSIRLEHWDEAVELLFNLAAERPVTVIIDEFPYLVANEPGLPSLLQRAIGTQREPHLKRHPRLLLCGSAMSFMGGLLSGASPLYGRAQLSLVVQSLGYRDAAKFWNITDPRLAVLTHSVVGGTPAYRAEFASYDVPDGLDDFDDWVCRTVLNTARPIHHEADFLLAAEPDLRDHSLYHSVLSAVANGNHTSGGIANYIGRKATDVSHPLTVLQKCGLLTIEPDAFRKNRTAYRIAEPLIAFHHAVVQPQTIGRTPRGGLSAIWPRSQSTFLSKVVGPHFEHLCREWVSDYAEPETFGGLPIQVTAGTVADPAARTSHEVDVVVSGAVGQDHGILLSVGEAKWNKVMDVPQLERLRHILKLLSAKGVDTSHARPACYSGAGFTPELRAAAGRGEVVLVDLERLYGGS